MFSGKSKNRRVKEKRIFLIYLTPSHLNTNHCTLHTAHCTLTPEGVILPPRYHQRTTILPPSYLFNISEACLEAVYSVQCSVFSIRVRLLALHTPLPTLHSQMGSSMHQRCINHAPSMHHPCILTFRMPYCRVDGGAMRGPGAGGAENYFLSMSENVCIFAVAFESESSNQEKHCNTVLLLKYAKNQEGGQALVLSLVVYAWYAGCQPAERSIPSGVRDVPSRPFLQR